MAAEQEVSRKQLLKEVDPVYSAGSKIMERLVVNKVPLFILLAIIVFSAAGLGIYQKQQAKKILQAEGLVFEMEQIRENAKDKSADAVLNELKTKFEEISEGKQKRRGQLLLADSYFQYGKFDDAEKVYSELKNNATGDLLTVDLARRGLGHVYESKKDFDKAIQAYKSIIDNPGPLPVFYVYLSLARSHELKGDVENAKLVLRDIEAKFPEHPDIERVRLQIKKLEGGS
ncbi:MAG: tetratricopeptide repeat protein [Candidatus Nitronauta litoralis]|uniref:Tetratricopeptide repeat protein n=1 Tax=Candidatus Nitronauta litoralis TaxID=2705533 RepID=A0A7T0BYR2_9BACT|nr:MAG: tetratricopeptide repeat protein [Candidatus Nitronauta litoralis]